MYSEYFHVLLIRCWQRQIWSWCFRQNFRIFLICFH